MDYAILARFKEELDSFGIIPDEQHGFGAAHSTVYQLVHVFDYITTDFNSRHSTDALFFAVAKAFDKVWHTCLVWKLMQLDVSKYFTLLVQLYILDRTFQIWEGDILSTAWRLRSGVPRDSPLKRIFYTIYASHISFNSFGTNAAVKADGIGELVRSLSPAAITYHFQMVADALEH